MIESSLAVVRGAGGKEYEIVGAARFTGNFWPGTGGEKLKMSSKKDHFSYPPWTVAAPKGIVKHFLAVKLLGNVGKEKLFIKGNPDSGASLVLDVRT